ncbi:MAG: lytic transglycosylase domain-containing protein [Candidatus Marinamargulisbacteria bacterium]
MATVVFVSAFVWFLFLTPPSDAPPLQPYRPPVNVTKKTTFQPSSSSKKQLFQFIKKSNPKLDSNEAEDIAHWIDEYAAKEDIDPMLVAALIGRESSFQKRAVSKTGAKGLGQIKDFNFKSLEISDPFDIKQNIRGTVRYLKNLKGMWKDSNDETRLVLASYYQGPNKTKKTHDSLPNHVTNYVDDILKKYQALRQK